MPHVDRSARLGLERFEERAVPAGITLQANIRQLVVEGTAGNDVAQVSQAGAVVTVRLNDLVRAFDVSLIDRVLLAGLAGNDQLVNNTGLRSTLIGGNGNDRLVGGNGNDRFDAGPGADVALGRGGGDAINGGVGNDAVFGGPSDDALVGGLGDDLLRGEGGNDALQGVGGRDDLRGDFGDDRLLGGAGDDQLRGGVGRDQIFGGTGNDRGFDDNGDGLFECEGTEFIAALTGSGGVGDAEFDPDTGGEFAFKLEADRLAASTTYTVRAGNTSLGQFTTSDEGEGDLRLTSRTLPILSGTVIWVFDPTGAIVLQGTFFVGTDPD